MIAKNKKGKVLVIGTSSKTRGGVTSVIKAHKDGEQWNEFSCKWIETHIDKGIIFKLLYFFKSVIVFFRSIIFYDILHIHLSEPISAFRKVIYVFFGKLFRKKIIIHFHSFSTESTIKSKYKWIYKYVFSKSDVIIVLSKFWKKEIEETFIGISYKIKVLYNPCIEPRLDIKYRSEKNILYAGTLNDRKGYKDLIEAFSLISDKYPKWKLIFAGNGEISKATQLVKDFSINKEQVVFLGWINGELKNKVFQEASIFCLPSYAEGFPMAVLDAWSYGLPVITTPVGGLPDVLKNEVNSLVFNPGDLKQLSIYLEKLMTNKTLCEKLKTESLKLSNSIFSKKEINKQIAELYSSII